MDTLKMWFWLALVFSPAWLIVVFKVWGYLKRKGLNEEYQLAPQRLAANPSSGPLRMEAVAKGRSYYNSLVGRHVIGNWMQVAANELIRIEQQKSFEQKILTDIELASGRSVRQA